MLRDTSRMVIKYRDRGAQDRRQYWSQRARKHANNAHRKGYWTIAARWDDHAGYRKALLNQGWDRRCVEHRPKQQKRCTAQELENKYGR